MDKKQFNYEYTEEELLTYSIIVLRKIADKYDINSDKNRQSLITDILEHQNLLQILKSKNNKQDISQDIKNNINTLPADTIRLLALNLSYSEIIKLCGSLKRFNNEICRNNIFQKQYGLIHLSSDVNKLPKDKEGNYEVIKEFGKLESTKLKHNNNKYIKYIANNNYDKYIIENIDSFDRESKNKLLILAARYGYLEIVKYLAENGATPGDVGILLADIHADYDYALRLAAENGHLEVVKYLVDNGANLNADDDYALRLAALNGYLEVVKYLVENGAHIGAQDDNALKSAVFNGHLEVVKYLVVNGAPSGAAGMLPADIHAHYDSALQWAAQNGHLKVVKYLIDNGADIHVYDDYALRWAAENGDLKLVKYLIEKGADIHANNDSALRYAGEEGRLEVVKYLIDKGANKKVLKK